MAGVSVRSNAAQFIASVENFKKRELNRIVAVALNRTAEGARAEASRNIRKEYNVKASELSKAFSIARAWDANLTAVVMASGKGLNLAAFGARQTQKGVSVAVRRTERRLLKGAFLTTLGAGSFTGVFMRVKDGDKLVGRFPIKAATTVSVPGMFSSEVVVQALQSVVPGRFERELAAALRAAELRKA